MKGNVRTSCRGDRWTLIWSWRSNNLMTFRTFRWQWVSGGFWFALCNNVYEIGIGRLIVVSSGSCKLGHFVTFSVGCPWVHLSAWTQRINNNALTWLHLKLHTHPRLLRQENLHHSDFMFSFSLFSFQARWVSDNKSASQQKLVTIKLKQHRSEQLSEQSRAAEKELETSHEQKKTFIQREFIVHFMETIMSEF